jgi:hypothetical protein
MNSPPQKFTAMLDIHVKKYMNVIPNSLLFQQTGKPTPPSRISKKSKIQHTNIPSPSSRHRRSHRQNLSPTPETTSPTTSPTTAPITTTTTIYPEDRLFSEDPYLPQTWIKNMLENKPSKNGDTIKELEKIQTKHLLKAGIPATSCERVFRGLFVYSHGVYEMITDLMAHCDPMVDRKGRGKIVTAVWAVYLKLLEQVPVNYPHLLAVFIGAEAKTEAQLQLANQKRKVRDMLSTQALLEQRATKAKNKQNQAEDEHAVTSALLGVARAKTLNAVVHIEEIKRELKINRQEMEQLQDHNVRLEKDAARVPGLVQDNHTLRLQTRALEIDLTLLQNNLETMVQNYNTNKEKLLTSTFLAESFEKANKHLTLKLKHTSSHLQQRNHDFEQERIKNDEASRAVEALNKSCTEALRAKEQLRQQLEHSAMESNDVLSHLVQMVENQKRDRLARTQLMKDADQALFESKARDQIIFQQEQHLIQKELETEQLKSNIQQLQTQLIAKEEVVRTTDNHLHQSEQALATCKRAVTELHRTILSLEMKNIALIHQAEESDRLLLLSKTSVQREETQLQLQLKRMKTRAECAEDERRRALMDFKMIEEGLKVRIVSGQHALEEQEQIINTIQGKHDETIKRITLELDGERKGKETLQMLLNDVNDARQALETRLVLQEQHAAKGKDEIALLEQSILDLSKDTKLKLVDMIEQEQLLEWREMAPHVMQSVAPDGTNGTDGTDGMDGTDSTVGMAGGTEETISNSSISYNNGQVQISPLIAHKLTFLNEYLNKVNESWNSNVSYIKTLKNELNQTLTKWSQELVLEEEQKKEYENKVDELTNRREQCSLLLNSANESLKWNKTELANVTANNQVLVGVVKQWTNRCFMQKEDMSGQDMSKRNLVQQCERQLQKIQELHERHERQEGHERHERQRLEELEQLERLNGLHKVQHQRQPEHYETKQQTAEKTNVQPLTASTDRQVNVLTTSSIGSQTEDEENRASMTLGRAKYLMRAAAETLQEASKIRAFIDDYQKNIPQTKHKSVQANPTMVTSECQTKWQDEAEKKEKGKGGTREVSMREMVSIREQEEEQEEEEWGFTTEETKRTNSLIVKIVAKNLNQKCVTVKLSAEDGSNGGSNQSRGTNNQKIAREKEVRPESQVLGNEDEECLPGPPPAFVAAALRRAFAQSIDDPAMWGSMWSGRGGGWSYAKFKANHA